MFSYFKSLFSKSKCSICYEKISDNRNCCITDCVHKFHTTCLLRCSNNICPLCRHELIETTQEEKDQINEFEASLARILNSMRYRETVEYALETIDKFYNMEESKEHYGYKTLIENVLKAYNEKNVNELKRLAYDFYTAKIDPEHPEIVIEWDLYEAFKRLQKELDDKDQSEDSISV